MLRVHAALRSLSPGYFALVMATGVVSIGLRVDRRPVLSRVLLAVTALSFAVLLLLTAWRFVSHRHELVEDFTHPLRGFGFYSSVAAANVLGVLGDAIMPGIGGKIMIIAVALSTIATLETTLVQVSRTLFAMGRDRTIPFAFGRINRKWKTPVFATVVVVIVSLLLFVLANVFGDSVGQILGWAVSSIGLQIAFYYSLAGFAVVIGFRKVLLKSVKNFILIGVWPLVGAVFMMYIFIAAFVDNITNGAVIVDWLGVGLLVIGVIPLAFYFRKAKATYFTRRPLEVPEDFSA